MSDIVITKVAQCSNDSTKQTFTVPACCTVCCATWSMTQQYKFITGDSVIISNYENVEFDLNMPAGDFPIPELRDFYNILVKAEGNSLRINVSWIMNCQSTSILCTTPAQCSKTVQDQLDFWINTFQPNSIEDAFTIEVDGIIRLGTIRRLNFSKDATTPITYKASLEFIAGDVVAAEG